MKRILFIDRDGTIIKEPPVTFQIDSLEVLSFIPGVLGGLSKIASLKEYELAMVTNQDGLGTHTFPEETFWPAQNKMMETLNGEGIVFDKVFIDKSRPEDNLPTRKPGTAMLTDYFSNNYDLANSYVIGDRLTDIQLAKNLGSKAILVRNDLNKDLIVPPELESYCVLDTSDWNKIYEIVRLSARYIKHSRNTKETKISIEINLDGKGQTKIDTGLKFFDHMLDQVGKHSGIDLLIDCKGDLEIDEHHTIEDTAITLGEAFAIALGNKLGIERYGFCLPMDDCLAQVAIDFGGRNWIEWNTEFKREKVGDMPTEMFYHFFKSFSDAAKANLNIKAEGTNEHHKIEAIFKGLAKAIKMAIRRDVNNLQLPSTKGVL
jgi:imidazoleglycerol-phosphate dehydratase/histidinol-phosphatase